MYLLPGWFSNMKPQLLTIIEKVFSPQTVIAFVINKDILYIYMFLNCDIWQWKKYFCVLFGWGDYHLSKYGENFKLQLQLWI